MLRHVVNGVVFMPQHRKNSIELVRMNDAPVELAAVRPRQEDRTIAEEIA